MAGLGLEGLAKRAAKNKELEKLKANEMSTMVQLWLEELKTAVEAGEKVTIRGFGTFFTEVKAAQTYNTPVMTAAIEKPARRVVKFRASDLFKQRVSVTER